MFDTLKWDAIDVSLEVLGFDSILLELVLSCVRLANFSALIEGSPTLIIPTQRGVYQGNPLFPLIFIVVLEYLSDLTTTTMEEGTYELYVMGFKVESHLYFVDGVIFFSQASRRTFTKMSMILEEFSSFFGLKNNKLKSFTIYFSKSK